jgi:hypothetical protein
MLIEAVPHRDPDEGDVMAVVYCDTFEEAVRMAADITRTMNAVPDLLTAAEAALRLWDNGGNPAGAFHNLRAAIEKAKGAL